MLAVLLLALIAAVSPLEEPVREGMAALERADFVTAERSFERASQIDPKSANVWFLLAQARLRQGKKNSALEAARRARAGTGGDANLPYNLALLFRDAGDAEASFAMARRALTLERSAAMFAIVGDGFAAQRDWKNASAQFEQAVKLEPASEEMLFRLTQCYLSGRDFTAAIQALALRRAMADRSPQLSLALGVAYYGDRRFQEAVASYLHVMEIAPDVPQPYYFLGRILEHARDKSVLVIERARGFEQRHPSSPLGFLLHARALLLNGDAGAQPLLETAIRNDARMPEPRVLLASIYERQQKYPEAAAQLEESVRLNPADPAAHFRLARVYDRLGRPQDAARERATHEKLSAGETR